MALRLFSGVIKCTQRRSFSSVKGKGLSGAAYREALAEEERAAAETMKIWKKLTIFVVCPAIILTIYNSYLKEEEHKKHERQPFLPWHHLRVRNKPFPWGDGNHSLFHNPHTNALPEGYEDEH